MNSHFLSVQNVIDDYPEGWKLISVTEDTTVAQTLEIMGKNRIISVPVQKANGDALGIVDMLDLITFCSTKFMSVSLLAEESYRMMEEFAQKPIKDIMEISGRNRWVNITCTDSLNNLIIELAKQHRVVVINESKQIVGLLTQTKLIEFLFKRRKDWPEVMQQRVQNLQKPVESINMKEFVISAFKKMWEKEVSGLAIVDNNGTLVGNISASDIIKLRVLPIGEMIHDLYQPIKSLLNIRQDIEDRIMMAELPEYKPISVTASDTLATSIQKCLEGRVHRVFIEDDKKKPVGVISLTDIICQFIVEV